MLIYSMSVSVDGYVADRDGDIGWGAPSEDLFAFHLARVREIDAHLCGRRLYETMLPWETDPAMRRSDDEAEFADVWTALPKVVFSRTLTEVRGNARLARTSLAEEIATLLASTEGDVEIGGATVAAAAVQLGLVEDFRVFRVPVVLGGGTPYLPPLTDRLTLDLVETRTFASRVVYEHYRRADGSPR